ncbi:MAG: Ni/Fe-hydrogenase, b-type cytochrome subunit [Caenispirillum bisanense]|nr:Ni/Fe-hydrogenase, b-type cytochrome subunit [Caenispirillum bisanense]MCA1974221.1 Ni/Fe-hydrogenase, b-type cytochrome subunit [Caenispirillum sp.]
MSAYTSKEALKEVEALGARQASIYVYEAPVRLWHWINALAMTVLAVTGWFIASPLPSVPGEASANFLMGTIRVVHFAAGYVLAIGFLGRIYWAFVGNRHARQIFYVPVWDAQWWREIVFEAKWYAFLERDPKKYVGHNPLAHFAMFTVFVTTTVFMIVTGFALYAEGTGMVSWQYALFGWVIALFGDTYSIHTWHHVGMWVLVIFAMVHIYAAIREDIMSRQTMISTMVNGLRSYKDDQP